MNFKKSINKYLAYVITFIFLFVGAGCSNQSNNGTTEKNTTTQTQSSQEVKKESAIKTLGVNF